MFTNDDITLSCSEYDDLLSASMHVIECKPVVYHPAVDYGKTNRESIKKSENRTYLEPGNEYMHKLISIMHGGFYDVVEDLTPGAPTLIRAAYNVNKIENLYDNDYAYYAYIEFTPGQHKTHQIFRGGSTFERSRTFVQKMLPCVLNKYYSQEKNIATNKISSIITKLKQY